MREKKSEIKKIYSISMDSNDYITVIFIELLDYMYCTSLNTVLRAGKRRIKGEVSLGKCVNIYSSSLTEAE